MSSDAPPVKKRVFKVVSPAAPPPTPPMKQRIFKVARKIAPPPTSTALTLFTKHDRFSGEQLDDEMEAAGAARAALLPRRPAPPIPAVLQVQTTEQMLREHMRGVRERLKGQK